MTASTSTMTGARPRVLVVLHDVDDNLGEIAPPLAEAGVQLDVWDVERDPGAAPAVDALLDYSGIISLGAYAGVLDEADHSWMPLEKALLSAALEHEVPVLGLCFGSQLLAAAAGAAFMPSPRAEFGWTRARLTPAAGDDPVLAPLARSAAERGGDEVDVFHYHSDSHELPEGAVLLAETDGIIEAYRLGTAAWGLQFHLEVGLATQLAWIAGAERAFAAAGVDRDEQRDLSHLLWRDYQAQAHAVGAAFAQQVLDYASRSAAMAG